MTNEAQTVTTADALTPQSVNELPTYPALSTTSDKPVPTVSPAAAAPSSDAAAPVPSEAATAAGDTEEPAAAEPEDKPKRGRPSKADREMAELRESIASLTNLVAAIAKPAEAAPAAPRAPEPPKLVRPKRADFDDPDAFEDALIEYASEVAAQKATGAAAEQRQKETAAEVEARAAKAQQEENEKIAAAWKAKVDDAAERYDDFEAVAFDKNTPMTMPMIHTVINSEYGADIAYWLGSNKAEAKRISGLANPIAQALAIGRLDAAFAKAAEAEPEPEIIVPKPAPRAVSTKPAVRPLTPRSAPVDEPATPQNSEARIEAMLADLRKGNNALGWGPPRGNA